MTPRKTKLSGRRWRTPIANLPPRPDAPEVPYMDTDLWGPASERIATEIADYIKARFRSDRPTEKRGRGRPKDQRAHVAGLMARYEYEEWTGQKIGRTLRNERDLDGPYIRFLQLVLNKIGSKTQPITIVLEQKYPGMNRKKRAKKSVPVKK